jgi:hypothetical protein
MGLFDNPEQPSPEEEFTDDTGQEVEGAETQEGEQEGNRQPGEQAGNEGEGNQQQEEQLILGKFKSQEDLARAYQEAQSRLGQMGNELGQLRQQVQPQQPQQQQEPQQEEAEWTEEDWQNYDNQFMQEFAQNPGQTVYGLVTDLMEQYLAPIYEHFQAQEQEQVASQAIENELSLLLTATDETGQPLFPGCEEMADQIDEYLEKYPQFLEGIVQQGIRRSQGQMQNGDYGLLDVLYRAVKAGTTEALGQQAYQTGLQQGAQQAQMKTKAGLPKAGAKNANPNPTPEEEVINGIMSFKKGGMFG